MSVSSVTCCSLLSAVCAFTLVSTMGCETDAQGIDECREIEQTRCTAAKECGFVTDVAACQRFYRDQCLHGLPVASPGSVQIQKCVATIRAAGQCVQQAGGSDTLLRDCDPPVTESARGVFTACNLVKEPEKSQECSFLTPGVDAGPDDASSAAGSGGESGDPAQAGTGGADGDPGQAGTGGESGG
jgi:hypothetical protein